MKMPVVIFCGGQGSRMKEETEFRPKPMVSLGGKPILWHIMKIYSHYGYNRFIIALGYKGDYIKDYFLSQEYFENDFNLNTKTGEKILHKAGRRLKDDFDITFVNTGVETLTGERLLKVRKYIDTDRFMVTYGDGVSSIDIGKLVEFHEKKKLIGTISGVHPKSKWGLVISNPQGTVEKFEQKPRLNQYVNGGFMVFSKDFFKYLRPREMVEVALERLIKDKQLGVYIHEGFWSAMDTYQDVEEMNKLWKKNPLWKVWKDGSQKNKVNLNSRPSSGNKVLVTGDRGYIGSVLVKKLLERGVDVVGLDTGYFDKVGVNGNKSLDYEQITKDIRSVDDSDLKGVDSIIHLSALSNDPMGAISPRLTEEINFLASVRLAKLAKKAGVSKFIFSSSCSIYGIAKNGIVDEKSKVNPQTAYAESKIATEKALKKLSSKDFFVGLMRNSTVFGFSPKFRNDLVVNNLITSALALNQIRIMSDGSPWRPLIDVRDLSDIFIEFLKTDNQKLNGKVINIGFNDSNFQVKDVVTEINKQITKCEVVYTGEHGADTRSYKVDFTLFKKYFKNVEQNWPLQKSVKDMIANLKNSHFSKREFDSGKYTRLAVLKKLIENKSLDKNLYWK